MQLEPGGFARVSSYCLAALAAYKKVHPDRMGVVLRCYNCAHGNRENAEWEQKRNLSEESGSGQDPRGNIDRAHR